MPNHGRVRVTGFLFVDDVQTGRVADKCVGDLSFVLPLALDLDTVKELAHESGIHRINKEATEAIPVDRGKYQHSHGQPQRG